MKLFIAICLVGCIFFANNCGGETIRFWIVSEREDGVSGLGPAEGTYRFESSNEAPCGSTCLVLFPAQNLTLYFDQTNEKALLISSDEEKTFFTVVEGSLNVDDSFDFSGPVFDFNASEVNDELSCTVEMTQCNQPCEDLTCILDVLKATCTTELTGPCKIYFRATSKPLV